MATKESVLTIGQRQALALKLACVISEHLNQLRIKNGQSINQVCIDGASEAVRVVEMMLGEME